MISCYIIALDSEVHIASFPVLPTVISERELHVFMIKIIRNTTSPSLKSAYLYVIIQFQSYFALSYCAILLFY